jgi:hypothetical protein
MRGIGERQWVAGQGHAVGDRQAHPRTARTIGPAADDTIGGLGNLPDSATAGTLAAMPRVLALLVASSLVLGLAACGREVPAASFDPASACTTDGRFAGAYPDLEALLPAVYGDRVPDTVDSGRNCTDEALGILADEGVDGVRFAGATWGLGGTTGLTIAVFEGTGLDASNLLAFYEDGARKARRTERLLVTDTTVGDAPGRRLDVLGSDGTGQTIVTWPADAPGRVNVVLASDLGDTRVAELLAMLGER